MHRNKRLPAAILALAVGTSLFSAAVPPAMAAPPNSSNTVVGHSKETLAEAVTLINGATIQVTVSGDGHPSAILPAGEDYYTRVVDKDLYVFPAEAQNLIASGVLDPELFNVTGLIAQGYGDAESQTLPLIMQAKSSAMARSTGLTLNLSLESIGASALTLDKSTAAKTYDQLLGSRARAAGTVQKIWLDARVSASSVPLDPATGVEQTGAPEAWDLGFDGSGIKVAVLDTGYDTDHPDLAGQVVAAKDFTGEGIEDHQGHGTHVASTVGGAGLADASKIGMAPQSDLLVGKVLGNWGGQASWIIDGMEWAVEQDADVVNMSLGSDMPTDCSDPMSLASEQLSEQSTTLFVVAAGNAGLRETVSAPGCAEGVLTVGAVDAKGEVAAFSSRGATMGGHRVKPDLSAPGVDIAGARAGGTDDEAYTTMSGTSMASPHVAGAAALLRQAHPGYTAQQLKAALVSSAKPDAEDTVYAQGSGELWTPAAIATELFSETSIELGEFDWPHDKHQSSTRPLTYTNTSDKPMKLKLKLQDLTGADGKSVPSSLIEIEHKNITVPANGSATVDITAKGNSNNLRESAFGEIGARIVATEAGSGNSRATTSVGFWLEPKTVSVTVKAIDRNGKAATRGFLDLTDMHQPARAVEYFTGEDLELRVRAGEHLATAIISTISDEGDNTYSYVGQPQMSFSEDTTLILDAREAIPVTLEGDRPMAIRSGSLSIDRAWDETWRVASSVVAASVTDLYVTPTQKVKNGTFNFGTYLRAYDPDAAVETSSYLYNLAFTNEGRVSKNQHHHVPDSSLGTVEESWHAQGGRNWEAEEWARIMPDEAGASPFYASSGSYISTPLERTAYYSPELRWQQLSQSGPFNQFPELWFDPIRTYPAGSNSEIDWFKLPTNTAMAVHPDGAPSRVAERQGNLVGFSFPQWKDSEVGRTAIGGLADIGKLSIYEDGQLLDTFPVAGGTAEVGAGNSTITAVVDQRRLRRNGYWDLGFHTQTTYTFESQRPDHDETVPLPIALPIIDAEVDGFNRAPAQADFPVRVDLLGQEGYDPGGIARMTASVNYDRHQQSDEDSEREPEWIEATVVKHEGKWQVLVDNTLADEGFVSLKLDIVDGQGARTGQLIKNLYAVNN
ncbi:S8 family peptidase [Glutamicibacter sp.]|uniref:S8 family peptidase n=1 Tax=Glutamicibacter sp. TaxID=1931995 RepID=UPI003D6ACF4E